jgi:hypothetical protein
VNEVNAQTGKKLRAAQASAFLAQAAISQQCSAGDVTLRFD